MSWHHHKKENKEIIIIEDLEIIIVEGQHYCKHSPHLVLQTQNYITMALSLQIGQTLLDVFGLVDNDTLQAVSASFDNKAVTSSDASIVTVSVNSDGQVASVGVAAGSANISASADATYVDSNTGQSVTANLSVVVPVTVVAPPPAPENVSLVLSPA